MDVFLKIHDILTKKQGNFEIILVKILIKKILPVDRSSRRYKPVTIKCATSKYGYILSCVSSLARSKNIIGSIFLVAVDH